jgi:hypothetical protein
VAFVGETEHPSAVVRLVRETTMDSVASLAAISDDVAHCSRQITGDFRCTSANLGTI